MAVTSIRQIRVRLDHAIAYVGNTQKTTFESTEILETMLDYASNDIKTEQKRLVTGINCNAKNAYELMMLDHKLNVRPIKVLGYHAYQSFAEGEVDEDTAHKIGVELANKLWGEKFRVLVATHLNTNNYHNHFIICSASFLDGSRFNQNTAATRKMFRESDKLCEEYGLSVVYNPDKKGKKSFIEKQAEKNGEPTKRSFIRADIDLAVSKSITMNELWENLKMQGYEIVLTGKHPRVKPPGATRFFRLYNLGDDYTVEALKMRVGTNYTPVYGQEPKTTIKKMSYKGKVSDIRPCFVGYRALYLYFSINLGSAKLEPKMTRTHYLLREELLKMDTFIAQSKILYKNKIDTLEQLNEYKATLETKIRDLYGYRTELRAKQKYFERHEDFENANVVKKQILDVSDKLSALRTEIKLCDGIAVRSIQLHRKKEEITKSKIMNKEEKQNEYERRCGRSDTQNNTKQR